MITEYPQYKVLKNELKYATVKDIQKKLSANEVMIEYFVGNEQLYIFMINKDICHIHRVEDVEFLKDLILAYNNCLHSENAPSFSKISKEIYKIVIEPIIHLLITPINKIRVIPHDDISLISFDALNTSSKVNGKRYLIEDYETTYHYSASNFLRAGKPNHLENIALFAPIFDETDSVKTLKWSEREAVKIDELFRKHRRESKLFLRENANKNAFTTMTDEYDIVHLATHTAIDTTEIAYSEVLFSGSDDYEGLTIAETYNLPLNVELLILSSCETGVGEVVKDEGIISFTRGFSYIGINNIICSLWKVDDLYTSELMIEFYRNLLNGNTSSSALRKAKLNIMKEQSQSSPKQWAPFIFLQN